jgi:anion-transporting  ArsA/GET3 family ATPase
LGHIFGRDFLEELTAFFKLFGELYEGFRERHEHVGKLFAQSSTAFLVVAAPTDTAIDVARYFLEELRQRGLPLAGVVLNQMHAAGQDAPDVERLLGAEVRQIDAEVAPRVLARIAAAHARLRELVRSEERRIASLRTVGGPSVPLVQVPRLRGEVHDLQALLARHLPLFGSAPTGVSSRTPLASHAPAGVATEPP